eukprot:scaffold2790_cov239-Pinguiococcus_pyrenoidosus.AAC.2
MRRGFYAIPQAAETGRPFPTCLLHVLVVPQHSPKIPAHDDAVGSTALDPKHLVAALLPCTRGKQKASGQRRAIGPTVAVQDRCLLLAGVPNPPRRCRGRNIFFGQGQLLQRRQMHALVSFHPVRMQVPRGDAPPKMRVARTAVVREQRGVHMTDPDDAPEQLSDGVRADAEHDTLALLDEKLFKAMKKHVDLLQVEEIAEFF